jgi:hypothetical protein
VKIDLEVVRKSGFDTGFAYSTDGFRTTSYLKIKRCCFRSSGGNTMVDTRVVYLEEPGKIKIESITLPELRPNQVLIKTHQASVCGSERYFYRGITVRPQDEARGEPGVTHGVERKDGGAQHAYPMGPLGHEGGLEIRNLNAVHYTTLRSIENMREAYRAVQRGVFNLDVVFENSVRYNLGEIADVFSRESEALDTQDSLKTLIMP